MWYKIYLVTSLGHCNFDYVAGYVSFGIRSIDLDVVTAVRHEIGNADPLSDNQSRIGSEETATT